MEDGMLKLCIFNVLRSLETVFAKSGPEKLQSISNKIFDYDALREKFLSISKYAQKTLIGENKLFNDDVPLKSIFSFMRKNGGNFRYDNILPKDIAYPCENAVFDSEQLKDVQNEILTGLESFTYDENGLNQLFGLSSETLQYVPCCSEFDYFSMADYIKFSTCLCSVIYTYLVQNGRNNFEKEFTGNVAKLSSEKSLILFSCGFSGIQKFIYTIAGKGTLKALRSRSFYLEILLRHILDMILEKLGLPPSNILYSGGGQSYMLLPNTHETLSTIGAFIKNVNNWLIDNFSISLYLNSAYTECSVKNLFCITDNYDTIFSNLFSKLTENKFRRYSPEQIRYLNSIHGTNDGRECRMCSKSGPINEDGLCTFCKNFIGVSKYLLDENSLLTILKDTPPCLAGEPRLALPSATDASSYYLYFLEENQIQALDKSSIIRIYRRGRGQVGQKVTIGSYASTINGNIETFEELSTDTEGIKRIAVLRADVDNLGLTFKSAFQSAKGNRVLLNAALSKQLSLFFKGYLSNILSGRLGGVERFSLSNENGERKKVVAVYSGGDDMFIAGAWNEIIETAIDLKHCFDKFTAHTLTFSAGIGLFPTKYPIYAMADETGKLEDEAKKTDGKNAVALFGPNIIQSKNIVNGAEKNAMLTDYSAHCYKWDIFTEDVVHSMLGPLKEYFEKSGILQSGNGNAFLYRLKSYIEGAVNHPDGSIDIARYAYLLARLAPSGMGKEINDLYSRFSDKMYKWILNNEDRKKILTAITIFIYLNRRKTNGMAD